MTQFTVQNTKIAFISIEPNKASSDKWNQFRKALLNFFPENTGQHILSVWFDKLSVKEDKPNNKITLTGSSFLVDNIEERFRGAIMQVISKTQITLEFHYENNEYRPITYKQKGEFLK